MKNSKILVSFFSETKVDFEVMNTFIRSSEVMCVKLRSMALDSLSDFTRHFSGLTIMLCSKSDAKKIMEHLAMREVCGSFNVYSLYDASSEDIEAIFGPGSGDIIGNMDVTSMLMQHGIQYSIESTL